LIEAGFEELDETGPSTVVVGGKYFFLRNKSSLVAFTVGEKFKAGHGGFKIIGAHTDSPNLRIKPRSKRSQKTSKSIQVGVECYGGGLWHTWFDRDLSLSGRVFCRRKVNTDGEDVEFIEQRLVKIDQPILRVPNLAIHLQTAEERKAFKINNEDHLSPILAMSAEKALSGDINNDNSDKEKANDDGWTEHQEVSGMVFEYNISSKKQVYVVHTRLLICISIRQPLLLDLLASELDISIESIVDFELNLYDVQKASLGGIHSEFIHSARLDNLASCYLAVQALVDCSKQDDFMKNDQDISMVVLFDHEEIGSTSA